MRIGLVLLVKRLGVPPRIVSEPLAQHTTVLRRPLWLDQLRLPPVRSLVIRLVAPPKVELCRQVLSEPVAHIFVLLGLVARTEAARALVILVEASAEGALVRDLLERVLVRVVALGFLAAVAVPVRRRVTAVRVTCIRLIRGRDEDVRVTQSSMTLLALFTLSLFIALSLTCFLLVAILNILSIISADFPVVALR